MYDENFFAEYEKYLFDPSVRSVHNAVFSLIETYVEFNHVIDLGCGLQEFRRFTNPFTYVGVESPRSTFCQDDNVILFDYRHEDFTAIVKSMNKPLSFVSLFSSEIVAPYQENYELYERLFKETRLIMGLVSGFYYANRKSQKIVKETGEIASFQTLEPIEEVKSDIFHETRITVPCPSKMFGPNVIEVWKIFRKYL